jgi:thymidine phosphorylase
MRSHDNGSGEQVLYAAFGGEFEVATFMASLGEARRNPRLTRRLLQYEVRMLQDFGFETESRALSDALARLAN